MRIDACIGKHGGHLQHILRTHACFVLSETSSTMFSISVRFNESPCRNIQKDKKQGERKLHLEYILERHHTKEQTGRLWFPKEGQVQYHVKLTHLSSRICTSVDLKFVRQRDFTLENVGWRIFPTYGRSYIVKALLVSQELWQNSSVGGAIGDGLDCRISIPGRGKFSLHSTASRPDMEPTSLLSSGYLGPFHRE
jgi:hypothetical protein